MKGLPCPLCPGSKAFAEEKAGIAAKERRERKKREHLTFNQSAATAKTRVATKIICNCFAFLVSFFAFFALFCGYLLLPLLVLAVACRAIRHGGAQPALIVPGVDGGLGAPGVNMRFHGELFCGELIHIGLFRADL